MTEGRPRPSPRPENDDHDCAGNDSSVGLHGNDSSLRPRSQAVEHQPSTARGGHFEMPADQSTAAVSRVNYSGSPADGDVEDGPTRPIGAGVYEPPSSGITPPRASNTDDNILGDPPQSIATSFLKAAQELPSGSGVPDRVGTGESGSGNSSSQSTVTNDTLYAAARPILATVDPSKLGCPIVRWVEHQPDTVKDAAFSMPDSTVISSSEEYPGGANPIELLEPGSPPPCPPWTPHQPGDTIIETDGFAKDYITDLYVSETEDEL